MESRAYEIIVVGGGIAGSAAALRAAQYCRRTLWILGDKLSAKRSRGLWVHNIDNMISVHPNIVLNQVRKKLRGPEHESARAILDDWQEPIGTNAIIRNTMERIKEGYGDFVELAKVAATEVQRDGEAGAFTVSWDGGSASAPDLILATGVMDRQPFVKKTKNGTMLDCCTWIYPYANAESVLYCIRCEGHLTRGTRTAVIGSSSTAAQIAFMLYERYGSASHVLTNGEEPQWDEETLQLLEAYGIEVETGRLIDVFGERGQLRGFEIEGRGELAFEFAFVSLGLYRVYNALAVQLGAELGNPDKPQEQRHVMVDPRGETSVKRLFAVGDMANRFDGEPIMKQVYTCQEYAVRAVDVVDSRLRRQQRKDAIASLKS